ncbi:MAG TPA: Rrf2 family transcriptional regulator [Pyrinomonadaceae bacterium]|nr:Rrf2 family transcriptional regulator [Pyrinomonadaceae bacterium]
MVTKQRHRVSPDSFDMSTNSRFAVAVHVLSLMAWSGEEPLKSEQVAESVNTNPVVIRRILKELAEAGLVVSQTGSLGGSRLAHDAAETTLLDVYQALEYGGVFSLHRAPPSRDCPVGVNIETVLGDVLLEVDTAVERVLQNITINDVVRRLKPCGAAAASKSTENIGKNGKIKPYEQEQIALPELRAGAKSRGNGTSELRK